MAGKEAKLVELGAQITDLEQSLAASNASAATVSVLQSRRVYLDARETAVSYCTMRDPCWCIVKAGGRCLVPWGLVFPLLIFTAYSVLGKSAPILRGLVGARPLVNVPLPLHPSLLSLSLLYSVSTLEKEAAASSETASRALADKEEEAARLRERVHAAVEEKQVTHMLSHHVNLTHTSSHQVALTHMSSHYVNMTHMS